MQQGEEKLKLDPGASALVLIDLQNAIVGLPLVPHSGPEILDACMALANRFRGAGAPVFLVQAELAGDPALQLGQPVDEPMAGVNDPPPGFDALVDGLMHEGDVVVTKRQWGAFHGTELDLQLRRRGISTVVIAGIATNFGVESTARQAWEHGYAVVFAEDAMGSFTADLHTTATRAIFPRIGRVRQTAQIEF